MAETAKAMTTLELGEDGLFQIPISLKKIRTTTDVTLDTASPAGNPMKAQSVDLVTGEVVSETQKGVFRLKPNKQKKETWGEFRPISKEDLDTIKDATSLDSFTVEHFIPLKDVPFERVTDAYFIAPAEGVSAKALVLLAKALKRTKRAGVFKLVKTSRQHLAVVYEKDGGLIVNTLAFANDFGAVREAAEAIQRADVKVSPREQALADELVGEALAADADVLDGYEDDLIPLKADLVERALAGKGLPKRAKRKAAEVPDEESLEERLRASLKNPPPKRKEPVTA